MCGRVECLRDDLEGCEGRGDGGRGELLLALPLLLLLGPLVCDVCQRLECLSQVLLRRQLLIKKAFLHDTACKLDHCTLRFAHLLGEM